MKSIVNILVILIVIGLGAIYAILQIYFYKKRAYGYPGLSKRLLAFAIDYFILHFISYIGFFVYFGSSSLKVLGKYVNEYIWNPDLFFDALLKFEGIIFLTYIVYSLLYEVFSDYGSIGKRLMQLKVDYNEYRNSKVLRVIGRNLTKFFVLPLSPITFVLSRLNKQRKWLHDIVAGVAIRDLTQN